MLADWFTGRYLQHAPLDEHAGGLLVVDGAPYGPRRQAGGTERGV